MFWEICQFQLAEIYSLTLKLWSYFESSFCQLICKWGKSLGKSKNSSLKDTKNPCRTTTHNYCASKFCTSTNHFKNIKCTFLYLYISFFFVINSPNGHPVLWGVVVSHRVGIVRSDSAVAGGFWSRLAWTEQKVQELWNRWPLQPSHDTSIHPPSHNHYVL